MELNDIQLAQALSKGDIQVYEKVYKTYFKPLHAYACTILKDEIAGEEIVQQIFLKLWERKEKIDIQTSLKAYLYKAVYFDSLNLIKHEKIKSNYQNHTQYVMKNTQAESPVAKVQHSNLEDRLRKALNELPEQCRTVFQLSRFEELKYREIAAKLSISEKTVETHMGKALKLLRLKLVDFLVIIIGIMFHLKNLLS
ncbi:MAG: RNA polymerase sigma-70 factor [Chitinophagaceae bacterium]|nr:RNA polymerase sigma-70 factor [Chitinophagaceae bacterium]